MSAWETLSKRVIRQPFPICVDYEKRVSEERNKTSIIYEILHLSLYAHHHHHHAALRRYFFMTSSLVLNAFLYSVSASKRERNQPEKTERFGIQSTCLR